MKSLPWWIILIIIIILILLYLFIPWKKIYSKRKNKSDIVNKSKFVDKPIDKKQIEENRSNKPLWGIYNWFGKKQPLRFKKLVYVQEEEDCCELCRPFENKVLSLENYDKEYLTMSEAISKGYHHIGCKHIDIDFFPGNTIIPANKFSEQEKINKHLVILDLYKLENEIRNLKYEYNNVNFDENIKNKINQKEQEIEQYCKNNNLQRNKEREKPNIPDIMKFTN